MIASLGGQTKANPPTSWRPVVLAAMAPPPAGEVHFDIPQRDVLIDTRLPITLAGLAPHTTVTIHVRGGANEEWTSSATFISDDHGVIDVSHTAPIRGSYKEVDAMGLFWSVERHRDRAPQSVDDGQDDEDEAGTPESWTLTAEVAGQAIARTTIRRRRVAEGVRVMPLRSSGVVGTFYEPPGTGPHPAMVVLGGSEGGLPGPAGHAGGLASRGYAVLALGYFRAEDLPQMLENIPLEYFGTALA